MSPLWQFKAVSVFLYYNLPHASSSQPFLILHFVAARETPLFSSVSHNKLWRYSEACAAEKYCLCEHVRGSGYARAHLTLKINPRAAAQMAQNPTATQNKPSNLHHMQQLLQEPVVQERWNRTVEGLQSWTVLSLLMFDAGGHDGRVGRGLLFQTHCKIKQSFLNVRSPPQIT